MIRLRKREAISRESAIEQLRTELSRRACGEKSICRLAAESGIFCQGFKRLSDIELRRRYGWIAKRYRGISRPQLEEIADAWQMARQEVTGLPTSCDVQQVEHDACGGWSDFSDGELADFLEQLTGKKIRIAAG